MFQCIKFMIAQLIQSTMKLYRKILIRYKYLSYARYEKYDAYILKENKCCLHIVGKDGKNITYITIPPTSGNRMDIISDPIKSKYACDVKPIIIKIIKGKPKLITYYE